MWQVSPFFFFFFFFFFFRTISADRDDEKFAGCGIIVNVQHLVTSDAHFRALAGSGYRAQPITPEDFIAQFLAPQP